MNSLVSIIIPTKNSARTLAACLASVKSQDYKDIEIIVVDNKSSDGTKEIAFNYTDKVFDYGPERSAQRNFGVKNSKGDHVFIVDSDMKLSPLVISACVNKMKDGKIKAVIVPEESFGEGFWAKCKKLERSYYVGVSWMEGARFFKRDVFLEMSGYDEENTGTEDFDLSQRIKEKYGESSIDRIAEFIYHNEDHINLFKTCKKKFYYARRLSKYKSILANKENFRRQASLFERYKLVFRKPKILFRDPVIGAGMLFMKACEFFCGGLGYLQGILFDSRNISGSNKQAGTGLPYFPEITFILPTYNAGKHVELCLKSINKQDYPKDKVEIIVIDGGSNDETLQIARKYKAKILSNERRVTEYGKTIGIKESRGEFFILIDADNEIVERDWLQKMIPPILSSPDIFGVESSFAADDKLSSLNRYFARMRIADPLAKMLASRPVIIKKDGYKILNFKKDAVLITGANGFLWNKKMVMSLNGWEEKFEEANFGTFVHEKTGAGYAIPDDVSVRHYYCKNLFEFLRKRKKIALKIKNRIRGTDYVWVRKVNKFKIVLSIIYLGTFISPTIEAVYKSIHDKTFDWLWHPTVSFLTIFIYAYNFLFSKPI
ncbi:MAG TPA: glycosyltransferase [Candidatus Paceibacterota bacterium]|nr:glycosyltransferase [Candidatus Paceibacterota bacterium]